MKLYSNIYETVRPRTFLKILEIWFLTFFPQRNYYEDDCMKIHWRIHEVKLLKMGGSQKIASSGSKSG